MMAVHCDCLVLGVGENDAEAYADAEAHGADIEDCDIVPITREAAEYVRNGGDCRGLAFIQYPSGAVRIKLANRVPSRRRN